MNLMTRRAGGLTGMVLVVIMLSACGSKDDKKLATQSAARVNDAEITVHQINQALMREPGLTEQNVPQARAEVLDRLVDQQLAVAQALDKKLDRQPEVMDMLEAARREVLARAFIDHVIAAQARPTVEEGRKYYNEHPELFAQRRIYDLQELAVEASEAILPALRDKAASSRSIEEIGAWLKEKGVRFSARSGVRPAEQIPPELLGVLHRMKDGQTAVMNGAQGGSVVRIVATQSVPVDETAALPRIQQYLFNQRGKEIVEREMKSLREKARIEYLGDFASARKE
jgi:EpsD family peptidyl-prolyl cis-trans isomerase